MATPNKEQLLLRIAIPYYGSRVMPRFGLARHFYFVTVDPQTSQVADLQQHRWDPQGKPSPICFAIQSSQRISTPIDEQRLLSLYQQAERLALVTLANTKKE
jgi:hypothetical protein